MNIVIPARKGSKGVPKKNQLLLEYTLNTIPEKYHNTVIISTNDEAISNKVKNNYPKCQIHSRSQTSAQDTASTKLCLSEVVNEFDLKGDVFMLYLTYPERKWEDIIAAYDFYTHSNARSLLCREEIDIHPYLCLYERSGYKGEQLVSHNLHRRQDYPLCFKICHMITIFKANELQKLNDNLYNEDTIFYKIPKALDVDTLSDWKRIKK